MIDRVELLDGVSRRRILKASAIAGALAIGAGTASAHHGDDHGTQGGQALVRVGDYIPDEPFTLRFATDFDKPRSCQSATSPETNWSCYDMKYNTAGERLLAFEVRPEADHVDGPARTGSDPPEGPYGNTEYVLGPNVDECKGLSGWLSTSFRPA